MKRAAFIPLLALMLLCILPAPARALDIKEVTSPAGLKAWLVEDHSVPVVSLQFSFRGGVEQDTEDKQGLSVLAANLLEQGAGKLDSEAFQKALADDAISFGISASRDTIGGGIKALTDKFARASELARMALAQPRFDEAAIERTRKQQIAGIRQQLGDPEWQARRTLFAQLFPGHPYAMRSQGSEKTLSAITPEDLRAFASTRMARDNLLIAATGDITPEKLGAAIDAIFGKLPDHAALAAIPATEPKLDGTLTLLERKGAQSIILFAAPGIARDDPDWYAASILNYVLGGGGFESRLMTEVREKRGLTYGIGTGLAPMDHAAVLLGQAQADTAKAAEALAVTRAEWEKAYKGGITADELKKAQSYITGSLPLAFSSTSAIAGVLLGVQQDKLGIDYLDRRAGLVNAVTLNDIKRVAARLLDPAKLTLVVVGESGAIKADKTAPMAKE
ncbi:MAG: insulinase family protein [Alphaproteobacteria bacterium]|nr:insulinase family protein [Alphaproteobacteria bacterium]